MVKFVTAGRIFGMPWWLAVTVVFIIGRIISTAMLLWFAAHQQENPWTDAHPSLWEFSSVWDARWYNIIAEVGYPQVLPRDPSGHVIENAWAFLPLYPMTVKALMLTTGLSWNVAAVFVSVTFALAATIAIYRLLLKVLTQEQAFFAIVLFSVSPVSAVYQVAYAESMQIFLIAVALIFLLKRWYLGIIPIVFILGITRPGSISLAMTLGLHFIYRMWGSRRADFSIAERWKVVAAGAAAFIAGLEWNLIAGFVTGVPNAYIQTELAWRNPYIGWKSLVPFTPWIEATQWWFPGIIGWLILAMFLGLLALILFNPWFKRIGWDLNFWNISYSLYLIAVFFPQASTFRILAPIFPVLGAFAVPKSKVYRVSIVVLFIAMQWVWIHFMWSIMPPDWTPP